MKKKPKNDDLTWYRTTYCHNHDHGERGELDCMLRNLYSTGLTMADVLETTA